MDYLRSGYVTAMYSFDPYSGLMVPFTAVWYFAPNGAKPIGINHQYASQNWTRPTHYTEEVGEILTAHPTYSDGATPAGVLGLGYAGTAWTGQLTRLSEAWPVSAGGVPLACPIGPVNCPGCVGGVGAQAYRIVASGGTGDFSQFNGIWIIVNRGFCTWSNEWAGIDWQLNGSAFGGWGVIAQHGFTEVEWYSGDAWDCRSGPVPGLAVSGRVGTGVVPTITVVPFSGV